MYVLYDTYFVNSGWMTCWTCLMSVGVVKYKLEIYGKLTTVNLKLSFDFLIPWHCTAGYLGLRVI